MSINLFKYFSNLKLNTCNDSSRLLKNSRKREKMILSLLPLQECSGLFLTCIASAYPAIMLYWVSLWNCFESQCFTLRGACIFFCLEQTGLSQVMELHISNAAV